MRTLCNDVADCLNNAEVLGRVLWLAKYRKGKLVLKDHKITPRTGCSSYAEPKPWNKTHTLWGIGWMMKPMSEVSSRFRWETPGGWLEANFCMRLVKKRKSSILASDLPAHIQWPGQMDMEDDYKTYQHKNLKNNLNKEENHPHVISPIVECASRSPTSEPHGLCLPV